MLIQPVESIQKAKRLKQILPDREIIIHDSVFLCPIRMDIATRQLSEQEIIEFLKTSAYPELEEEGRMIRKNGKLVYKKRG